jgi:flagellar basal body-associated protein FliL
LPDVNHHTSPKQITPRGARIASSLPAMAEKVPTILPAPPVPLEPVPDSPQPAKVRRKSKFAIAALVIALTLLAAAAIWYMFSGTDNPSAAGVPPQAALTLVPLDGFTVNLNDGEENHYLRVTLSLGVEHMPAPLNKEKPTSGLPIARIRDTIVAVLADSKADALLTHEGKGAVPMRHFMLNYAREKDLALFLEMSNQPRPQKPDDLSMSIVIPAYILSELKTGFQIGAVLFLPFLVIDMVNPRMLETKLHGFFAEANRHADAKKVT